ncbi:MAG TPA: YceI family protein [Steroidobacteraceae bacterium]|nr:YceI family protein [Steroidobacteraceae bacterium]
MSKFKIAIIGLLLLAGGLAVAAAVWKTDPEQSTLSFVGKQSGADFEAVFRSFTADIQFDPKALATSRFSVNIDVKSVNSKDQERDEIIRGPDLFAVEKFPTARYVADVFTDNGDGKFSATGKLTIRDVTRNVPIEFTLQSDATGAWLRGSAALNRLDFGVGQGEWKDTELVADAARVRFSLRLTH